MLTEPARRAIVHPDLLRENIDGEALLWAQARLSARPESRKLLMVISDGAPVDDRLEGSVATATWAMWQGAGMVRAHDVRATVHAARVVAGGIVEPEAAEE